MAVRVDHDGAYRREDSGYTAPVSDPAMNQREDEPGGLPRLPARPPVSHKGTFGTVLVLGGRAGAARGSEPQSGPVMIGAPAFAATAALRAGAGLVKMLVPRPIAGSALEICPSATAIGLPVDTEGVILPSAAAEVLDRELLTASALVVGPGLGNGDAAEQLVYRILQHDEAPLVVDADALNAMAGMGLNGHTLKARAVLTPHPGEFARLAHGLKISHSPIDPGARPEACAAMARALGCIVALKGAGTVVSDGHRTWVCSRGHPCLATGGTGDVLAGLIGGLIAQFLLPRGPPLGKAGGLDLYDCARIGVEAHARAGEAWAGAHHASAGLLATELAGLLPEELEQMRG